ncbi:hypothetical protein MPTK1_5g08690 [Marchantia polymorpha subsp. ruderalis]|uniref:EamA domain-containing protein n=2 Tax=Marchantia polymorpha TaxID=3197 RepID=A0A176VEH8_MARPO|nr:hypothetical protein AXG93_3507s1120 [Marchantia polymorpha subsp. ruderalis]PTQ33755.1 hypothetical protein MARPO_0086s0073 [Marchantia polymorpha]BBN11057.1 hypothetical protein Mp_5g08690 [Marchantia polymorpha subsp. ruderalis]|eukprot:PTQ33755.1 hypothetical protein MARPO_0086s0073 [Marchantia polymorpha]
MEHSVPYDAAAVVPVSDDDYSKLSGSEDEQLEEKPGTPWFVWPMLAFSLVASSASGAIMKELEIEHAGAVSVAGWRFQVTALALLPCFLWQWAFMTSQARAKLFQKGNLIQICISAAGLTAYFGLWNWSLQHTSLTHSLFLSVMSPLYVAFATVLTGGKITKVEVFGVALGIIGSLILATGTQAEPGAEATLLGDVVAFISAGGFALYLVASRHCRASMPVYVYMFPSTVLVAVLLGIVGIFVEGWGSWIQGAPNAINGPFGWFANEEFLLWTIFLGIVPGFLCYIGYNVVLAFTSSLVVSMGLSICPLTGSLLGWFMGLTNLPNIYTIVGGSLTMAATIVVSWGTHPDEDKKEAEKIDIESRGSKGEDVEDKVPLLQDQRQP